MAGESHTTTEHNVICNRAEEWTSRLATVKQPGRGGEEAGILRINFPGYRGEESLEEIPWQEFSDKYGEQIWRKETGLPLPGEDKQRQAEPAL